MPNPHFDVQIISRGGGRSAVASASYRSGTKMAAKAGGSSVVAAASYRSGEKLHDERVQKTFDYQRKEDVVHKEILTPDHAPAWATDRETLWNEVEANEKRKDAQLARDIIAALPRELDTEQNIALVREFVQENFTSKGMIADIAIHEKQASDGGQNPHVHIMLTLRDVTSDGFGKKNRDWNNQDLVSVWRDSWESITNRALEESGREERVSLQSYEDQGIDKDPQKHVGYDAWHLEEKGIETTKGNENRQIHHGNNLRDIAQSYLPEPEAEVEPAPGEVQTDRQNLRQVGQALVSSGDTPGAGFQDLREAAQAMSETDEDPARVRLEAMKREFAGSMVTRTVQAGVALMQRMAQHTQQWVEKAKAFFQNTTSSDSPFDRYANLANLAKEQDQGQDREHER